MGFSNQQNTTYFMATEHVNAPEVVTDNPAGNNAEFSFFTTTMHVLAWSYAQRSPKEPHTPYSLLKKSTTECTPASPSQADFLEKAIRSRIGLGDPGFDLVWIG